MKEVYNLYYKKISTKNIGAYHQTLFKLEVVFKHPSFCLRLILRLIYNAF
jgi:hypothetical protein